jgi:RHS repeat-associated protein
VDATYAYDAFGNLLSGTGSGGTGSPPTWQHLLYAGEYYNFDLGLYPLGQRMYDHVLGRFTTEDTWPGTLLDPGSQDPYVYVENNPLIFVDPTGMAFCAGNIVQQARYGDINFCPVNGSPQEVEAWALSLVAVTGVAGGAYVVEILYVNAGAGAAGVTLLDATGNPDSNFAYLGKFNGGGWNSVVTLARNAGASYLSVNPAQWTWSLNRLWILDQLWRGNTLWLTSDPDTATGTFAMEVDLLRQLGYRFAQFGSLWRVIK